MLFVIFSTFDRLSTFSFDFLHSRLLLVTLEQCCVCSSPQWVISNIVNSSILNSMSNHDIKYVAKTCELTCLLYVEVLRNKRLRPERLFH